jgi:hypothetical protein
VVVVEGEDAVEEEEDRDEDEGIVINLTTIDLEVVVVVVVVGNDHPIDLVDHKQHKIHKQQ